MYLKNLNHFFVFSLVTTISIHLIVNTNSIASESVKLEAQNKEQEQATDNENRKDLGQTLLVAESKNGKPFLEIRYSSSKNQDIKIDNDKIKETFYNHIGVSRSNCDTGVIIPLYSFQEATEVMSDGQISFQYLIQRRPTSEYLYHGLLYKEDISPLSLNQILLPSTATPAILTVKLSPEVLSKGQYQMNLAAFCSASAAPDWNIESKFIIK